MQGVGVARCPQVATGRSVILGLVYPHGSGCWALESVCLSSFVPHLNLCACLLLTHTARLKMRPVPCSGVSLAVQFQISCPALLHGVLPLHWSAFLKGE